MISRDYENELYQELLHALEQGVPGSDRLGVICLQPGYSGKLSQYVFHRLGAKEIVCMDLPGELGAENKELLEVVSALCPFIKQKFERVVVVQHLSVTGRNLGAVRERLMSAGFGRAEIHTVSFLACQSGIDYTASVVEQPVKLWWEQK